MSLGWINSIKVKDGWQIDMTDTKSQACCNISESKLLLMDRTKRAGWTYERRVMDRKHYLDLNITSASTDNSSIKEFAPSKEIILAKEKHLTSSSPEPICCPSAVYSSESPPIVHHSLNNRPWLLSTRHLFQCSASARGKVWLKLFIRVKWRS